MSKLLNVKEFSYSHGCQFILKNNIKKGKKKSTNIFFSILISKISQERYLEVKSGSILLYVRKPDVYTIERIRNKIIITRDSTVVFSPTKDFISFKNKRHDLEIHDTSPNDEGKRLNILYTTIEHSIKESKVFSKPIPKEPAEEIIYYRSANFKSVKKSDFSLIKVVGRGCFTKVVMVKHKVNSDEIFAMKTVKRRLFPDFKKLDKVKWKKLTEICSSPFINTLEFAIKTPKKLYFFFQYLAGGELFFHLKESGKFSAEIVRGILPQIIMGVDHLLSHKAAFGVLKPENISFFEGDVDLKSSTVCITDFGVVNFFVNEEIDVLERGKSDVGLIPEYCPPEHITLCVDKFKSKRKEGVLYGEKYFVYVIGVFLSEFLTGLPPFYSENLNEMFSNIVEKPLNVNSMFFKHLKTQESTKEMIVNMMKKDPNQRPTFSEFKKHEFFQNVKWEYINQRASRVTSDPSEIKKIARKLNNWNPTCCFGVYTKIENKRVPLKSVVHDIHIGDFSATIQTTQTYVNESNTSVEWMFKVPIVDECTPYKVSAILEDPKTGKKIHLEGKIKEKRKAQEEYDDIIANGNIAVLIEKEQRNVISFNLGSIIAKMEVTITFEYIQELQIDVNQQNEIDSTVSMKFYLQTMHVNKDHGAMMVNSGKKAMENVDIYVKVNTSSEIKDVKSPSHKKLLSLKKNSKFEYEVSLLKKISNNRNFILILQTKLPVCSWIAQKIFPSSIKSKKPTYAHMLSIIPRSQKEYVISGANMDMISKSELIFIVDRSGSMSGSRIRNAKTALSLFLQSLDEDKICLFNIISFGSRSSQLFSHSMLFNQTTYTEGMNHIEKMNANMGGTDIYSAIKLAFSGQEKSSGYHRSIFLLTDGEDSNSEKIIEFVEEKCKGKERTRIFTFGIGNDINPKLLDEIATVSNGRSVFITSNEVIHECVLEQLNFSFQGVVHDLKIQFPKELFSKKSSNLSEVKDLVETIKLYKNQMSSIFFFTNENIPFDKLSELEINLSFKNPNQYNYNIKPSIINSEDDRRIGIITAKRKIQFLEKLGKKKEIERIGLQFSLISSQTSFIMSTTEINTSQNDEMKQVEIPNISYVAHTLERKNVSRYNNDTKYFEKDFTSEPIKLSANPVNDKLFLNFSFAREGENTGGWGYGGGFQQTKSKKSVVKKIKKIEEVKLEKILLQANIKGLWKNFSDSITKFLNLEKNKINKSVPSGHDFSKEEALMYWISALVITKLKKNYKEKEIVWKMIVAKTTKQLYLKKCIYFLTKAEELII